jgi:uncharacterized membrane protein
MNQNTNEKNLTKPKIVPFSKSPLTARIGFIIGIIAFLLTLFYVLMDFILGGLGTNINITSKVPLYIISVFLLILTVSGIILNGLSIREDKQFYGIFGLCLNGVLLVLNVFFLIVIITAGFPLTN